MLKRRNRGGPNFKIKAIFSDASLQEISKLIFNKPVAEMYYKVGKNAKGVYGFESVTSEWMDDGPTEGKVAPPPPPATHANTGDSKPADGKDNSGSQKTPASTGCNNPMPEPDFDAQLVGVSARPFEPIKLSAAKKLAEAHCLRVSQVVMVMAVFDSEQSRLTFAKYAYDHTYNQDEYADVSNALHNNKSKDDLNKYISGRKK